MAHFIEANTAQPGDGTVSLGQLLAAKYFIALADGDKAGAAMLQLAADEYPSTKVQFTATVKNLKKVPKSKVRGQAVTITNMADDYTHQKMMGALNWAKWNKDRVAKLHKTEAVKPGFYLLSKPGEKPQYVSLSQVTPDGRAIMTNGRGWIDQPYADVEKYLKPIPLSDRDKVVTQWNPTAKSQPPTPKGDIPASKKKVTVSFTGIRNGKTVHLGSEEFDGLQYGWSAPGWHRRRAAWIPAPGWWCSCPA